MGKIQSTIAVKSEGDLKSWAETWLVSD